MDGLRESGLFLKKLEIQGFKSFADKTELVFEPGVIAVVGPNGCGKTNVSDSIRWVLGEQSTKSMRAPEMSSVIFNGTEARKPSSLAEVTLVLSNEDKAVPLEFNEIAITRRIYRDNESDYLINGAPARLKDVKELFMGTGIGSSAYSVMQQGQIDRIILSKPSERRILFEEAAGITKYKSRKEEALRKLEATEQNLVRITDIVAELKRQMTSLEKQAKQAEKYRKYREEHNTLQIQLQLYKVRQLKGVLKDLHQKMHQVRSRLHESQQEAQQREQEEKKVRETLTLAEQEVSEAREAAYKIDSEVEVAHGRIEGARQHRDLLAERRRRNAEEVAAAQAKIEQLGGWIRDRRAIYSDLENRKQAMLIRQGELEARVRAFDDDLNLKVRFLETKNNDALGLVTTLAQMKAELDSLRSQEGESDRRITDLKAVIEILEKDAAQARERCDALARERETARAEEGRLGASLQEWQGRLADIETRLEAGSSSIRTMRDDLSGMRSRYSVLEELQNKFTGYDAAVKTILQEKQREPLMWQGVLGVVADLLSTDQSREAAVESLLGSRLQSLVVQTRQDADRAVERIRNENVGKAAILVLEDLAVSSEPAGLSDGILGEPGVLGLLRSFLHHEPSLEPAVRHLFGNDVAVESWEKALELGSRFPQLRFVTPEGDVAGPLGSRKAGSAPTGTSLFGRHREMVELAESMRQKEKDLSAAEQMLLELRNEGKHAEEQILEDEGRRQQVRIRLAEIEKETDQASEEVTRLETDRVTEDRERQTAEDLRAANAARASELQGLLAAHEQSHHLTQEAIAAARQELSDMQSSKDEAARQAMQAALELEHLEETARGAQEEAERYQKESDQLALSIGQKTQENVDIDSQETQLSLALTDLEGRVSGLAGRKAEADSKVQEALRKREEIACGVETLAGSVRNSRDRFEEVQQELHGHEVQEAQVAVELRNIEEKLQVELHVDLDNPPTTLGDEFSEKETEQKLIELHARIERLGLVNMVAFEEYDEISSRFKFLSEQREDLTRAKEDLEKAIQKINLTSKELFTATFAQVQDHFKDIFQRLFEGGRAELILIDEGDILDSGVEIVARPPGKRLSSVSLLSGGEKALTAIALMFALFMVKPSPFCLMDEIDAPLDDVNVVRFTHLLKEFSGKTQFFIITHNKITMEAGDVMYGVTMEESGVSKIISARFKEGGREEVEAADTAVAETVVEALSEPSSPS